MPPQAMRLSARQSVMAVSSVQHPAGRLRIPPSRYPEIGAKVPGFRNSTGAPRASPTASPTMAPRAASWTSIAIAESMSPC